MTDPTPRERAQRLSKLYDRWDDSATTIEITKPPSKAAPIPEDPSPFDDEDEQ